MPTNSILTIHNQSVSVQPIVDRYHNRSPFRSRSSAFVQTKGLTSNEKRAAAEAARQASTSGDTTPDEPEPANQHAQRRALSPSALPFGTISSASSTAVFSSRSKASDALQASLALQPGAVPQARPLNHVTTSDIRDAREVSFPPLNREPSQRTAAGTREQGNTKKKRRSLTLAEEEELLAGRGAAQGDGTQASAADEWVSNAPAASRRRASTGVETTGDGEGDDESVGSGTPYPNAGRGDFGGNPNKLARFFPELTLGS